MEELQNPQEDSTGIRNVGWKGNNSTILPLCRGSLILVEDSGLSYTLGSLHCTDIDIYCVVGIAGDRREMKKSLSKFAQSPVQWQNVHLV